MKFWSQMPIKENPSMEDVLMLGDTLDVNNPKTITLQQMMDIAGEKVSSVEVVEELPAEGRENKLYIKKISQDDTYVYESYIWDDNAYHQMSNGGGGSGDSVWEKDANNNIFPKGNTNVTGTNCFVTGLTSKANHNNNISIGYNNESRSNNSIVIGVEAKDFDPSGDELGWINLIAIGNNPVIPPRSLNTSYATWQSPKFIIGGLYASRRFNTLEQTVNGDLYIKGINGWDGTNATPDGTSHLQGYLSGLDTRITNNTTAIEGKQDTISAGDGIDVTNNVVSVDNTVAKKADVYTKGETDSLLGGKQNTLTAGTGIDITNNVISVTGGIDPSEYVRKTNPEDPEPYIDPNPVLISSDYGVSLYTPFDSESGFSDENVGAVLQVTNEISQMALQSKDPNTEQINSISRMVVAKDLDNTTAAYISSVFYNEGSTIPDKGSGILIHHSNATIGSHDKIELKIGNTREGIEIDNPTASISMINEAITATANDAEIAMQGTNEDVETSSVAVSANNFTYNGKNVSVDPTAQSFSNNASLTLADNTIYTASEKISAFAIDDWGGTSVVSFDTATSGGITITLPQTIKFVETPTFGNNEHWEIAVRNGYAVYTKYNLV